MDDSLQSAEHAAGVADHLLAVERDFAVIVGDDNEMSA